MEAWERTRQMVVPSQASFFGHAACLICLASFTGQVSGSFALSSEALCCSVYGMDSLLLQNVLLIIVSPTFCHCFSVANCRLCLLPSSDYKRSAVALR